MPSSIPTFIASLTNPHGVRVRPLQPLTATYNDPGLSLVIGEEFGDHFDLGLPGLIRVNQIAPGRPQPVPASRPGRSTEDRSCERGSHSPDTIATSTSRPTCRGLTQRRRRHLVGDAAASPRAAASGRPSWRAAAFWSRTTILAPTHRPGWDAVPTGTRPASSTTSTTRTMVAPGPAQAPTVLAGGRYQFFKCSAAHPGAAPSYRGRGRPHPATFPGRSPRPGWFRIDVVEHAARGEAGRQAQAE